MEKPIAFLTPELEDFFDSAEVVDTRADRIVVELHSRPERASPGGAKQEISLAYSLLGIRTVVGQGVVLLKRQSESLQSRCEIPNEKRVTVRRIQLSLAY